MTNDFFLSQGHYLFFGDPKKGATFCIQLAYAPSEEQQKNLREMLDLYYVCSTPKQIYEHECDPEHSRL